MATLKKGQTLECNPCGREVTVSKEGVSPLTVYCCVRPMRQKTKTAAKQKTAQKTGVRKTARKSK